MRTYLLVKILAGVSAVLVAAGLVTLGTDGATTARSHTRPAGIAPAVAVVVAAAGGGEGHTPGGWHTPGRVGPRAVPSRSRAASDRSARNARPARAAKRARDRIAFTSNRTGTAQIWLMDADGSDQTRLTHSSPMEDIQPAWSPDGTRIAFSRSSVSWYESTNIVESAIYVMNADGSDQRLLASAPATTNTRPQWSPDGRHILFVRGGPSPPPYDIWVMKPDGTEQRAVTTDGKSTYPAWSPNGTEIAFLSTRTGTPQVFVMRADGTMHRQLTAIGANYVPSWAPGERILFSSTRDGGGKQIYVMNPDGSGQTRVRATSGADKIPTWSPDGTRIAFGLGAGPDDPIERALVSQVNNGYEIYTMRADGTGLTRLTHTTVPERQFGESYPVWKPRA